MLTASKVWHCQCGAKINIGDQYNIYDGTFKKDGCQCIAEAESGREKLCECGCDEIININDIYNIIDNRRLKIGHSKRQKSFLRREKHAETGKNN